MLVTLDEKQKQIVLILFIALVAVAGIYFYQKRRGLVSGPAGTSDLNGVPVETIRKLTAPQDVPSSGKILKDLSAPKSWQPAPEQVLNSLTAPLQK